MNLWIRKWIKNLVVFLEIGGKTHNQGVFDAYTPRNDRNAVNRFITVFQMHTDVERIIGGLSPSSVIWYCSFNEAKKKLNYELTAVMQRRSQCVLREEGIEPIACTSRVKRIGRFSCFDILSHNKHSRSIQWLYFAYLAAIKEQNGLQ